MLCESKSGYVWFSIIYTGKGTVLDSDYKDIPMSSQVVMTLMKPLLGPGYCLTMDYFTHHPSYPTCISHTTDTYRTVRMSRKDMSPGLKTRKLKKGETAAFWRDKNITLRLKDEEDVMLLSTIHSAEMVVIKDDLKSKMVVDHNNTMGGVDKVDQHLAAYSVP
ncbi:hypothetical protein ANN_24771 [Periplaneta americana]|uniref:PiggyBac transposable element-derived protein domain-containing protein n=1 Tax=Periplaneta americana TaxID=6978 RepID=A0ABQ8S030_PERAM|nr:hypothetical protein ANN_24771 [Periplaneta americana]